MPFIVIFPREMEKEEEEKKKVLTRGASQAMMQLTTRTIHSTRRAPASSCSVVRRLAGSFVCLGFSLFGCGDSREAMIVWVPGILLLNEI